IGKPVRLQHIKALLTQQRRRIRGEVVLPPGARGRNAAERARAARADHLDRRPAVLALTVAELAVDSAQAPGPHVACAGAGRTVPDAAGDTGHSTERAGATLPHHLHRRGPVGNGAVAQLTKAVVAPRPHAAVS